MRQAHGVVGLRQVGREPQRRVGFLALARRPRLRPIVAEPVNPTVHFRERGARQREIRV